MLTHGLLDQAQYGGQKGTSLKIILLGQGLRIVLIPQKV